MIVLIALAASQLYLFNQIRESKVETLGLAERTDTLQNENEELRLRLATLESRLPNINDTNALASASCDHQFPGGFYRLSTKTSYGPSQTGEYDIYNVSVKISEWQVNVGARLNSFAIPTDFYVDYDGDGRIDTALAARFAREIPVAGNTIADRLLADSRVHQNLYNVFSCEWRDAEYTSADDMSDSASETSNYLWDLVESQSHALGEWIEAL